MILLGILIIIAVIAGIEIGRLLVLKHELTSYALYWQHQNKTSPPTNAIRYVALGDSTAQAIGASSPERGYVWLFYRRLSLDSDRPVQLLNFSKSGAKIRDALDVQLPRLADLHITPDDIVTIEIGANDMRTYDKDIFYDQFDTLCKALPPQTVISDMPYFGGGRARNLEPNVVSANTTIHAIAKKYSLRVAPLYAITKDRDNLAVYAADWFHPSNKGYRNWSDAFWAAYSGE